MSNHELRLHLSQRNGVFFVADRSVGKSNLCCSMERLIMQNVSHAYWPPAVCIN
jgi:hypothetical protein